MKRIHDIYRPLEERKSDWNEVERPLTDDELKEQTSRCMNCGQPFCHAYGCPLGNLVPDQNRAVAQGDWKRAYDLLSQNSDFPEFTSRICPALCEASCVHQLDEESVMVRQSEKRIIETAFNYGWVVPRPPAQENGKKVAIIGAGPAGLSAAVTLRRRGWAVTVYERRANIGGKRRRRELRGARRRARQHLAHSVQDLARRRCARRKRACRLHRRRSRKRGRGAGRWRWVCVACRCHRGVNQFACAPHERDLAAGRADRDDSPGLRRSCPRGSFARRKRQGRRFERLLGDTWRGEGQHHASAGGAARRRHGGQDAGADCVGTSGERGERNPALKELRARAEPCRRHGKAQGRDCGQRGDGRAQARRHSGQRGIRRGSHVQGVQVQRPCRHRRAAGRRSLCRRRKGGDSEGGWRGPDVLPPSCGRQRLLTSWILNHTKKQQHLEAKT